MPDPDYDTDAFHDAEEQLQLAAEELAGMITEDEFFCSKVVRLSTREPVLTVIVARGEGAVDLAGLYERMMEERRLASSPPPAPPATGEER